MFCAYCGNPMAQDSQYCATCGKPVTPAVQPETSMSTNQQRELKLVERYDQELADFGERVSEAFRAGKEDFQRFIREMRRRIDIYDKQVQNYSQLFPGRTDIRHYEARVDFFKGMLKVTSSFYHGAYGGILAPTKSDELRAAISLFERSLQMNEYIITRRMKVLCYRQLGDKKSALQELDYILEHYADNEGAYLEARKEKDELEAPSSSGIGKLVRSIFG